MVVMVVGSGGGGGGWQVHLQEYQTIFQYWNVALIELKTYLRIQEEQAQSFNIEVYNIT